VLAAARAAGVRRYLRQSIGFWAPLEWVVETAPAHAWSAS
jgi:hypothetical protein